MSRICADVLGAALVGARRVSLTHDARKCFFPEREFEELMGIYLGFRVGTGVAIKEDVAK
jgi:hypothetical protein